jgi:hypothetical protein
MKKLFIIELKEDVFGDYDRFDGFVVRASNEKDAWELADKMVKSTPHLDLKDIYFNKERFYIKELSVDGEDEIILASYMAG